MFVTLRLVLDCDADTAWRLLRSPAAMRFVMAPIIRPESETPLPQQWQDGASVELTTTVLGIAAGRMTVEPHASASGATRILTDLGRPQSGPLAALDGWRHRMAVTPIDDASTLFRDRLDIRGTAAPLLWPQLWLVWQWRGIRLRELARREAAAATIP